MSKVIHTCTGCIPIDASIVAVYAALKKMLDSHSGPAGGGSNVEWDQLVNEGTKIAKIKIGNRPWIDIFAPNGGGGGDGDITVDSELSINSENPVQNKVITNTLNTKQDRILDNSTYENMFPVDGDPYGPTPTANYITDAELRQAISAIDIPSALADLSDDTLHRIVTDAEKTTWNRKQDALVSNVNIKTVKGQSLLGRGNIDVQDGKSAYQLWIEAGHAGTMSDFLASLQGDPGSSQDYPFSLVNNLVDGGTTEALTAEMGKQLSLQLQALRDAGFEIAGIATESGDPGTPSMKVAYLAGYGTYENYGDLTIGHDEVGILCYNNSAWSKQVVKLVPSAQVDDTLYEMAAVNLFDPEDTDIIYGYYIGLGGELYENSSYLVSGYIPFTPSMKKLILSVNGTDVVGFGGYIALYDSDKRVLNAYNESDSEGIVEWEERVAYARFSVPGYTRGNIQIEVGDTITEYIAPGSVQVKRTVTMNGASLADSSVVGSKMASGAVSPDKCSFFKTNLFDPDDPDVAEGYYLNHTGYLNENSVYLATGYIPFASGTMCASANGTPHAGGGYWVLYDRNKNVVASGKGSDTDNVVTWQTGVAFARFSIANYTDGKIQVETGSTITEYIRPGDSVLDERYASSPKQLGSILGEEGAIKKAATLAADVKLEITEYPSHLKKGDCISFFAKIGTFTAIYVGKGYDSYRGTWLKITSSSLTLQHKESEISDLSTVAHGLTIGTFVKVAMSSDVSGDWKVVLNSIDGVFQHTFTGRWGHESNYAPFAFCSGGSMTDCVLTATNTDFRCPVWACGDSYFGMNTGRWPGWMIDFGYSSFLINGLAGQTSQGAFADLQKMLAFGTPKYLLWTLGMNDTDASFASYFDQVKAICDKNGITMIAATVPSVRTRSKETITNYVKASGLRYIDFYKAVGANSSGEWYEDYQSSDGLHPDTLGAQALATQVLVDFPELMQYGNTKE